VRAPALSPPWIGQPASDSTRQVRRILVTGVAAGLAGAALFVVIHSLLIFPIWTRFAGHLPFALMAGLGLAAAFDQAARDPRWRAAGGGARFGLVIFATLAPATVLSNSLRVAGLRANGWPGFTGTLGLAVVSGAAAGWLVTKRRGGAVAFAAATLALTIAMGGAIPVVNGPRAALLYAGFLPISVGSGIALAVSRRGVSPEEP
jgi:hypothetical protein